VLKYPFFSWMGLLATILLILLLIKLRQIYMKYVRKWCKINKLESDIGDKFKQFKEIKETAIGHQYNNLKIRLLVIDVLLNISGIILYVLPLFIVYMVIIDLGNYWIWFVCFFVLNFIIGMLTRQFGRV